MATKKKVADPVLNDLSVSVLKKPSIGIGDKLLYRCGFCSKRIVVDNTLSYLYTKRFSNEGKVYCNNCIRLRLNTKLEQDTLLFSLRAIPGFYFNNFFMKDAGGKKVYLSTIKEYMEMEQTVGLTCPVFSYDPETAFWFIDFSRIGRDGQKIRLKEVKKVIIKMICCYNLYYHIQSFKSSDLWDKLNKAIDAYYMNRERPSGIRLLAPTLKGCMPVHASPKDYVYDQDRNFGPYIFSFFFK